ncbi:hypothetical protein [Alloactinosynnema sp. L-07]|uniref:hypothetical protein n=1 Tax=Alloactinosynnema sp. L-07 TaxID=1653480 RepID=UPI0012F946BE|nr:hypothetical protein [Alloactinosynnema sp. L-07]
MSAIAVGTSVLVIAPLTASLFATVTAAVIVAAAATLGPRFVLMIAAAMATLAAIAVHHANGGDEFWGRTAILLIVVAVFAGVGASLPGVASGLVGVTLGFTVTAVGAPWVSPGRVSMWSVDWPPIVILVIVAAALVALPWLSRPRPNSSAESTPRMETVSG